MPKNPLKFARRKSSGNVLESDLPTASPAPAVSSFRVLERPQTIKLDGDGRASADRLRQVPRPFNSPLQQLRGRSAEELSAGVNRGSGGTTNSGSSGYIDSSSASLRHSSTSTLPSSVDAERDPEDDELFPRKSRTTPMHHSVSAYDDQPPPPPSFKARAARALSFGQNKDRNGTTINIVSSAPPLPVNYNPQQRERATTTSSYASTAVPSKPNLDLTLSASDFTSDFGNMFDTPKPNKFEEPLPPPPPKAAFHRTESEPMFPPRTHSRQAFRDLPEELTILRGNSGSPYSQDSRSSDEGLITNSALNSPRLNNDPPPVPPHANGLTGIAPAFLGGKARAGYSLVSDRTSPGLERVSHDSQRGFLNERDSYESLSDDGVKKFTLQDAPGPDTNSISGSSRTETITQKPVSGSTSGAPITRKPLGMPSQATAGASRAGAMSPDSSEGGDLWDSRNATPRAARLEVQNDDGKSLFDSSPLGLASRALPPKHMRTESDTPKRMTKAQFERLQRGEAGSADQTDEEDGASADEYDDEDEADQAKKLAKQRQKQEANMAVYRQQMKKVTGGGPSDLPSVPRPSLDRAAASAPAAPGGIHLGGIGGKPPADAVRGKENEEDDEDVPLGILQAHGFPSASRPPTRQGDNDLATQRRNSASASVVGGGAGQGNLPPFARRLPADPYFGSSVVNQTNRESLGMTAPAGSVYGGAAPAPQPAAPLMPVPQPQMGHPGGLVGVIAGEERAKAARRGSPNTAQNAFTGAGAMPNMGMMGMGAGRTMSMGNLAPPQTYMPSGFGPGGMIPPVPMIPQMPMMPMTPDPQQEQMKQFMQMQMQVMQNMLAMQQHQMGQTPPPQQQPSQDYLGVPIGSNRQSMTSNAAPSIKSQAAPNQGRAMTMMNPPTRWDVSPGAQRPNSAMPTTYAPSGLNINGAGPGPGYTPSIAPSERSNVGMPSRYRPVTSGFDGTGRSQSMTSSATLLAFNNREPSPTPPMPRPVSQFQQPAKPPTVRKVEKPKSIVKTVSRAAAADEDDDEGWAEMRKKREDKKKFRFGKKTKTESALGDLYQSFD